MYMKQKDADILKAYTQGQLEGQQIHDRLYTKNKQLQAELDKADRRMTMLADTSVVEEKLNHLQAENEKYESTLEWILIEAKVKDAISVAERLYRIRRAIEQALKEK